MTTGTPPQLAVTTRSGLRGLRHFPLMFVASRRIKRQLARTPGCVRFASIIAGPREFWTITVWESRDKMLDFMRSGAHEEIMWLFDDWLRSFWLLRWRPTSDERGSWDGRQLAVPERERRRKQLSVEEQAALEAALDALPTLAAAVGPDGAASYESSPFARKQRKLVAGAGGLMVRLAVPRYGDIPEASRDMARVYRRLRNHPAVLRCVTGVDGLRQRFVLAVLRDDAACEEFLTDAEHARLAERWGDGYWAMRWAPANEFGHWDGLRLRRERLGAAIPVPAASLRAAGIDPDRHASAGGAGAVAPARGRKQAAAKVDPAGDPELQAIAELAEQRAAMAAAAAANAAEDGTPGTTDGTAGMNPAERAPRGGGATRGEDA